MGGAPCRSRESAWRNLLAPNDPAGLLWICPEECVALGEMPVNRRLAKRRSLVIAVVDDGSGHPTEDGFDDIEELCA
jgi:hypothetical protein